jgi:hypothetical protein
MSLERFNQIQSTIERYETALLKGTLEEKIDARHEVEKYAYTYLKELIDEVKRIQDN